METCNSYIHVIDAMLWPCDFAGERCGSISTALGAEESIETFNGMLRRLNDTNYDLEVRGFRVGVAGAAQKLTARWRKRSCA